MSSPLRRIALPLLVLAVGIALAAFLVVSRKKPAPVTRTPAGPLVEAITVHAGPQTVVIHGTGTVRPRRSVQIIPQVAGSIVEVSPSFTQGGFFDAGEVLLRIDPSDYEANLHRAEADVARAEVQLAMARAEAEVARREWERDHPDEEPSSPLVVKEPQVRQAEADLAAARAAAEKARTDLERTRISLPYAGRIVTKNADLGQYVAPGQVLATAYGTDVMEVPVPLRDEDLAWFHVPRAASAAAKGSPVTVHADFGGRRLEWKGAVSRTEGEVDLATRMVRVVVEIPGAARGSGDPPLPGMFVEADIHGRRLDRAFAVPRHAVHESGTVWVASGGRLHFRTVEVAHTEGDTAFVVSGLEDGDLVITSQLEVVTDGMKVRVAAPQDSAAGGKAAGDEA